MGQANAIPEVQTEHNVTVGTFSRYYQDRGGWDPNNQFNPTTILCLSKTRTWISIHLLCSMVLGERLLFILLILVELLTITV